MPVAVPNGRHTPTERATHRFRTGDTPEIAGVQPRIRLPGDLAGRPRTQPTATFVAPDGDATP
jgi:hypothetical protein